MNPLKSLNPRGLTGMFLLLVLTAVAIPLKAEFNAKRFRIGYQKAANTLVLLKTHDALAKRLQPLGVEVTWLEFTAGPQLMEGLNAGAADFGYVGEVPPIFALAAGANFVYIAYELPTPEADAVPPAGFQGGTNGPAPDSKP
jgi:sulfonate transport system substrate-binding protein